MLGASAAPRPKALASSRHFAPAGRPRSTPWHALDASPEKREEGGFYGASATFDDARLRS